MEWFTRCPAKLNLFLSVGTKDEHGWHPLRTVFQAIDLFDLVTVQFASKDDLVTDVEYLPAHNTLTTALELFRDYSEMPPVAINVKKTIPPQSGLGGGSSDAAGLLRILQRISSRPIAEKDLMSIARRVGADVPFFVVGGRAKAQGYGEQIEPLQDCSERTFVVVKPEVDCSTSTMFRALDALQYSWRDFPSPDQTSPDSSLPHGEYFYNDFERVMPEICATEIERLREFGAIAAGLSGSGSAVFGEFENRTAALTAIELLKGTPEKSSWVCRSLGREECVAVF